MTYSGVVDASLGADHAGRRRRADPEQRRLRRLFLGDDDPATTTIGAHAPELANSLLELPLGLDLPESGASVRDCDSLSDSDGVPDFSDPSLSGGSPPRPSTTSTSSPTPPRR